MQLTPSEDRRPRYSARPAATSACSARATTPTSCSRAPASASRALVAALDGRTHAGRARGRLRRRAGGRADRIARDRRGSSRTRAPTPCCRTRTRPLRPPAPLLRRPRAGRLIRARLPAPPARRAGGRARRGRPRKLGGAQPRLLRRRRADARGRRRGRAQQPEPPGAVRGRRHRTAEGPSGRRGDRALQPGDPGGAGRADARLPGRDRAPRWRALRSWWTPPTGPPTTSSAG